ncbi:ricin-type beta-trefoil lectin domain protein [Streptomyces sp. NPDC059851]|uniref:ricin-type beta-trefoil lectin domain protein n=1 Tax=Streptomyces sp. NPDC059851 TaxID=3346971 RepID=UPI0036585EF2
MPAGSQELPSPPVPTPQYEARATERSGAHYKADADASKSEVAGSPDFAACTANPEGHNPSNSGSIKNHFEFCRWGYNKLTKLDGSGRVEGQVIFKETEVGEGSSEKRIGTIHIKVTDLKVTGTFIGASMTMSPSATGYPGACTTRIGSASTVTEPLTSWGDKYLAYEVIGNALSGDQTRGDKPLSCNFQSNWKVDGKKASSDWYHAPEQGMRMDSGHYLAQFGRGQEGTIFPRTVPWFSYDYNDPNVKQVAEHIFSAYMNPASTEPHVYADKKIPGWRGSSTKLTRNWPEFNGPGGEAEMVSKRNESAKDKACRNMVKGDPTYQCDEFPFASTMEGAGSGHNFSVRYVPQKANGSAGGKLAAWYARDRILHGDQFQVFVENHGKLMPGSLLSMHSGKALDVAGWAPGAPLQIWEYWGGPNQDFTFNDDNELRVFGNHCLDGGAGTPNTRVTSEPCSGADSQKWVGGTSIPTSIPSIFHAKSGLCLDVSSWGTDNGNPVILWDCNAADNQKWRVAE